MTTQTVPGEVLNQLFLSKLGSADGGAQVKSLAGDYIRDRLREDSFAAQVLNKRTVNQSELQRSVNHDYMVKLVEIEPQSRAMSMSFRGQPRVNYYTGDRFEVPFHSVGSERFEQTEQELRAYSMPITQILRRNIVNDISEIHDSVFLNHCESAVQALQKDAAGIALTTAFTDATCHSAANVNTGVLATGGAQVGKVKGNDALTNTVEAAGAAAATDEILRFPVQKDDMVKLFQVFSGNGGRGSRVRCAQFLINDTDFEDLNSWALSDVGEKLVGESTTDGYKSKVVIGRKYIRTLKTDILRQGNIYAFAEPEFLGGFLVLNGLQFYADKERNRISFEAWEDTGMYIGNVAAVRKLETYCGSVEVAGSGDRVKTARLPFAEKDLGRKNNLVAEGGTFPNVAQF